MYFDRKYRTGVQFRVTSLEISILMIGGKRNTMKTICLFPFCLIRSNTNLSYKDLL